MPLSSSPQGFRRITPMVPRRPLHTVPTMFAAIFNLNHPAHTIHWHFLELSVANLVVVVVMLAVFVAALLVPFPGRVRSEGSQ
ncbi:MAG: hypothetical protein WCD11_29490 [Solirubrobacteraceae bacterium]